MLEVIFPVELWDEILLLILANKFSHLNSAIKKIARLRSRGFKRCLLFLLYLFDGGRKWWSGWRGRRYGRGASMQDSPGGAQALLLRSEGESARETSATRSTIIVPVNGIVWFLDLFNYYVSSDDQDAYSKELNLDTKISEASVSRNRSTIIVPAGSSRDEGWAAFRNILAEINDASHLFILPGQNSEPSEGLPGLSDDVGAGFIPGHSSQSATPSELNVDRSVELPSHEDIGGLGVSKVIRADQKRFFFDLGSNTRGHFLRISEVAGADRSTIILPLSGLKQFHEMLGHFVEITKDRLEGMTGANVRTVDPAPR
ncbi:Transcription factor Pur-alpha 1 [Acorus calamus]|uniref:Transcription factor Pur-alpha 1 n=1 Tax=Acorus calamus TaxID=4465 RepID=A0AAV9D2U3_ACOCL|nr:Transcription factor Pur-alpha 1 [Acorus calamus]